MRWNQCPCPRPRSHRGSTTARMGRGPAGRRGYSRSNRSHKRQSLLRHRPDRGHKRQTPSGSHRFWGISESGSQWPQRQTAPPQSPSARRSGGVGSSGFQAPDQSHCRRTGSDRGTVPPQCAAVFGPSAFPPSPSRYALCAGGQKPAAGSHVFVFQCFIYSMIHQFDFIAKPPICQCRDSPIFPWLQAVLAVYLAIGRGMSYNGEKGGRTDERAYKRQNRGAAVKGVCLQPGGIKRKTDGLFGAPWGRAAHPKTAGISELCGHLYLKRPA